MALPQLSVVPVVAAADSRPSWRFQISLAQEEATVVSFKKLVRDAERIAQPPNGTPRQANPATAGGQAAAPKVGPTSPPKAPLLGGDLAVDGLQPPANRFSSVIERIERLYTGHESEEEEDTRAPAEGAPKGATPRQRNREDDFYDTDDSFIDDHDLDAYFSDQGEPEHQGFVVTKGALKPRVPRAKGEGAGPPQKRKRRRLQVQEEGLGGEGKDKVKKKGVLEDGNKSKPAKKVKAKGEPAKGGAAEGGQGKSLAKKQNLPEKGADKVVTKRVKKERPKEGGAPDENAALALPAVGGRPIGSVVEQAAESMGPAKREGPDVAGEGVGPKKAGKKATVADKVAIALQVSKDREDAERAMAKREAEAKKAKKKSEAKKGKKECSAPPERTENQGSILTTTVSGVPIGLLNAEISNARTLGSVPESKKRARGGGMDDSRTETEETAPTKKVKVEAGEEVAEEGRPAKPRKPRATDQERLEAAIAELAASVAEHCPPVTGGEAEGAGAQEEEGEEGAKKKRLPTATQAALSRVARVAGMRKGAVPVELYPRLLPLVGHLFKRESLKCNLKRALAKAIEAKKGSTTPKKDTPKKGHSGNPRRKEDASKPKAEQETAVGAASPPVQECDKGPARKDESGAPRITEAKAVLEELIRKRTAQAGEEAAPSGRESPGGGEAAFEWDHPTENALLTVSRVAKEGAGEQNGQLARQLYKELAQLWPPGKMDVQSLQKALRRAKGRLENKRAAEPSQGGSGGSVKKQKEGGRANAGRKKQPKGAEMEGGALGSQMPRENEVENLGEGGTEVRPGSICEGEKQSETEGLDEGAITHSLPSVFKHFQASPLQAA